MTNDDKMANAQRGSGDDTLRRSEFSEDLHQKTLRVTMELTEGLVLKLRQQDAPLEAVLEGQLWAVMETLTNGFQMPPEMAADVMTAFADVYREAHASQRSNVITLQ